MTNSRDFAAGGIHAACGDGLGMLTIDNQPRRNALTAAMWRAIPDAVTWLIGEAGARVIVLAGAGGRDFSAGADISEFAQVRKDTESARIYEAENSAAFAALRQARVPVIAAVRGICYGGGLGLAAACDLRLGTASATFAVPAARLGLAYPADAIQDFYESLGPQMARQMLFTGAPVGAQALLANGFLLDVTEDGALDGAAFSLADTIAANAPLSVQAAKLALRAVAQQDADLLREADIVGSSTFDSRDYAEGRAAFAERRKPIFEGR
ncbi:enoyl-CoA hydratase-related protein [Rhizobium sp. RU36D]|uniref:enoyl-CoA hydratase-related protein n=1 Tax=Rhizobium sp. RU36D TaxID=1907415 RepID=UPI000A01E5FA|nr:enoyl-CoA hydratase-related protein [Rhizobium sp. RU36D]